ncbi:MAG: beta-CASP ribonuclease aCPSF1 [Candidatus Pacearchaeota archaeon]|nr:MAG: beta-CASP ribonuclease aCPSF1 [Candidatus Pacearchaeota archaeon]
MPDILKTILNELPPKVIDSANFEGANIVVYTSDEDFFLKGEEKIRQVVDKIKKRIELRASKSLLIEQKKAEDFIKKTIPKDADIQNILFDEQRSIVVIEVKKPGIAIGRGGEILKTIKEKTFWIPQAIRSPAIRSKITEAIRHVLFTKEEYRKKFLNSVGKKIYKEWSPEKREEWIRLTFLGGARQVGRSCILLQTPESKILLDCGIDIAASNSDKFPYLNVPEFNIKEIDAVILSHPHLDHSGLLPYLYKIGYRGPCYMTTPTRDITSLLALDFIGVSYKKAVTPLYRIVDIKTMVKHSIDLNYNEVTDITPDVRLTFYNAGHTLGSAMIHLNIGNGLHNLLYTSDFKYARTRVLDLASCKFPRLETLIIESTYGGKQNILPSRRDAEEVFIAAINKTIKRKGKALVPVLGVGRAQEVMMIVDNAAREGKLPNVPIYVDGMVWDVTAIHTAYPEFLSPYLRSQIFQDKNPFTSKLFKRVGSPQERKEIIEGGPCIILATSGMLVGGASVEYFRELADNKHNSIIFVSYQGPGSLGRQVQEGIKEVKFSVGSREERVSVNMETVTIDGMTGHAGRNELLSFVNNLSPTPRRIIVQHGEVSRSLDLASTLYKLHKIETTVPRNLETIRLR